MRAQEFAAVASRLARIPTAGPADFRTSISRAYYAAYLVGVDALTHIGAVPHAGPGGHSEVANSLIASGDDAVVDAGRALSDLHTRRIHADYRMARTDVETRTSAQSACEIAQHDRHQVADCPPRHLQWPERTWRIDPFMNARTVQPLSIPTT
jgi:hypothetical protein